MIDLPSYEKYADLVTNPYFAEKLKLKVEADSKRKADIKAAAEASRKRHAEQAAKQRAEIAAAEAKFKSEGWWEAADGIYVRWCTNTCDNSSVIGDNTYSLMEVWAKDRAAGDIYAQVNLMKGDVVVGWTNDTLFLDKGQKGVLTFDTYQSPTSFQLTKFSARGTW